MNKFRRSVAWGAVLMVAVACADGDVRPLDSLVERDGRYLDPADFRAYSGPVVATFRDALDAVELSARLVDGRFEGAFERYYRDGALFSRGAYRAGRWHGPFESFYADGSTWMQGTYDDGVLDGPYVAYDEAGGVTEEGAYASGVPCGTWTVEGVTERHPPCPDA